MSDQKEFAEILRSESSLTPEQQEIALAFRAAVLKENEQQNLTRLLSPRDFYEGHIVDCQELMASGLLEYPVLDIGSGAGVPGLLCAALGSGPWVLTDSEGHKAAFLERTARELGLSLDQVRVFSGRAEDYLREHPVATVTARAVGPVLRIYGWLRGCSTWNKLVLLKGPGWSEEWAKFQAEKHKRELALGRSTDYVVGAEKKKRTLVEVLRVPRGTR